MAQAAGDPDGRALRASWQWGRTEHTQRALLDAAAEVFGAQGFASARMTDIAARARMSPGAIYHHFGGKSELYLALWRRHGLAHEEAATQAVARARQAGVGDGAALWEAGARAVLHGTWMRRDLSALFFAGNGPPGFESMRRERRSLWDRQADALLQGTAAAGEGLYPAVLTALMSEGARAVTAAATRRQADAVIDEVMEYARRHITGGPARAAARDGRAGRSAAAPAAAPGGRR